MKQLSALLYIKRNFKKVCITTIALLFGVFGVYFFSLATETTLEAIRLSNQNIIEKSSYLVMEGNKEISSDIIEKLKISENTEYLIPVKPGIGSIRYHMGLSSSSSEIFNLYNEDMDKLFEMLDLKIIDGDYPTEGLNEILISDRFAKQNNIEVGSILNNSNLNVKFSGDYKVCGIYSGDIILAVINENTDNMLREDAYRFAMLYKSKDDSFKDMKNFIDTSHINVYDSTSMVKELDKGLAALRLFTNSLSFFMIIILCLTLGNLNIINFTKRKKEMFILQAIGYSKKQLVIKLWKENLIACFTGYVLGIILTIVVVLIMNILVYEPKGSEFAYISINGLLSSSTIPIFVSVFSLIPCITSKRLKGFNS